MKNKTTQSLIFMVLFLLNITINPNTAKGNTSFIKKKTFAVLTPSSFANDDGNIKIKAIKEDWKVEVQISYDGDEGQKGKLIIYNSQKQLINEFEIELKKSPEFITLNLAEFSAGTYTVELITVNGKHTSNLIIK